MTEDERADWLARAVDDLIHGTTPRNPADDLDKGYIQSLLRIARVRRESGRAGRQTSANHEGDVWQSVIERLEPTDDSADRLPDVPQDEEAEALSQVIAMRRSLSSDALNIAEEYRDEVWRRVQERITKAEGGRKTTAVAAPHTTEPQDLPRGVSPDWEPFTSGRRTAR